MKYLEFKNGLEQGLEYAVYLFEGEDAYFREKGLELIKNKFVSEPSLNYVRFDGAGINLKELYASLTAYPFLSKKRLTVVREFYPDKNAVNGILKDFFDNPPTDGIFVVLNEKPCETLKKTPTVCVVECKKADVSVLVRWMRGECAKYGVSIDGEAAQKVAEYCLSDMTRIENEINKLTCYVGVGGRVTVSAVDELVSKDTEYKIYEMTDYIGKKRHDEALAVVKEMLSKGETPQRLLLGIYNYFRRLLHVAIANGTDEEKSKMLGVKEYAVKKAKEQAKLFNVRKIKKAVDMLSDFDFKIKSGTADMTDALWLSVFSIMSE